MSAEQEEVHAWDGCLMCAVRALTEGRAATWAPHNDRQVGDSITGVVLRMGEQPSAYEARVPYVELWLGGPERVRVAGHGMSLRNELLAAEPQVGDTLTVTFEEIKTIEKGPQEGKEFKVWSVQVKRGHH